MRESKEEKERGRMCQEGRVREKKRKCYAKEVRETIYFG